VTWVQPEDLIGHELRQAREEGKDVDAVEARWFGAGGAPAPGRGASQEPVAPALRSLALELLDELDALTRPLAPEEPEGFDEIGAASKLDLEEPGRTMAEVAEEIFAKDRERFEARARALAQLSGEPA
jgi:hypothetical protein